MVEIKPIVIEKNDSENRDLSKLVSPEDKPTFIQNYEFHYRYESKLLGLFGVFALTRWNKIEQFSDYLSSSDEEPSNYPRCKKSNW